MISPDMQVSVVVTVAVSLFTGAISAVVSLWASSVNAAKFLGSTGEKFDGLDEDVARLENMDRDLWKAQGKNEKEISDVRVEVAHLKGRVNGRSTGHSAGSH